MKALQVAALDHQVRRIARVFVDDVIAKIVNGTLDTVTASMAK